MSQLVKAYSIVTVDQALTTVNRTLLYIQSHTHHYKAVRDTTSVKRVRSHIAICAYFSVELQNVITN